jgi:hypothetical protein
MARLLDRRGFLQRSAMFDGSLLTCSIPLDRSANAAPFGSMRRSSISLSFGKSQTARSRPQREVQEGAAHGPTRNTGQRGSLRADIAAKITATFQPLF